jgi:hypothetical protein
MQPSALTAQDQRRVVTILVDDIGHLGQESPWSRFRVDADVHLPRFLFAAGLAKQFGGILTEPCSSNLHAQGTRAVFDSASALARGSAMLFQNGGRRVMEPL